MKILAPYKSIHKEAAKRHPLAAFSNLFSAGGGFLFIILTAGIFHLLAQAYLQLAYAYNLPHYDSMGVYRKMFDIINAFGEGGFRMVLKFEFLDYFSWLQSFFAIAGAPFLDKTPASLQLYNTVCVFLFMISVYITARSGEAGRFKSALLPLIIFLPDTFYNWNGGLFDLQRDTAYILLLGATYFLFFAYTWKPSIKKAIFLGTVTGLTILSRGNAVYILLLIMGPIFLFWTWTRWRSKNLSPVFNVVGWAGAPVFFLGFPYLYFTLHANTQRYLNPFIAFNFTADVWTSFASYWTMPFRIMFGTGGAHSTRHLSLIAYGLMLFAFLILKHKGYFRFDFSSYAGRFKGFLLSGLWVSAVVLFLLCFVLRWNPQPYETAKLPFYPSLLTFLTLFFVFGMSIHVNPVLLGRKGAVLLASFLCCFIFIFGTAKLWLKTPRQPPENLVVAHDLAGFFSKISDRGKVAYLWHDTISIDTLRYFQAQKGLKQVRKFYYTSPDGNLLDFAVGTPPDTDIQALLLAMKKQIEEKAAYVVVNIKPGAYANHKNGMFIFRYGQPVIDSILQDRNFEKIYEYELWKNRPWGGKFVVLENQRLRP